MYARTVTAALVPGKADEAIRIYREQVLPLVESQSGSVRVTLLIDRKNNQAMAVTQWESTDQLEATGQGTAYLQEALAKLRGVIVPKSVEHWEVAIG